MTYIGLFSDGHKKIKGPAHIVEGGHHLRKAPQPPPTFLGPGHKQAQYYETKQVQYTGTTNL